MSKLPGGELKSNLGDLLRCTVLLECMGSDFLWITDAVGKALLDGFIGPGKIALIEEGLEIFSFSPDLKVFNLDNFASNADFFGSIRGEWKGYVWEGGNEIVPENRLLEAIQPYSGYELECSWQEALVRGMGFEWHQQDYANYVNGVDEVVDVGLNWNVHPEWTSKHWPKSSWEGLYDALKAKGRTVSWQEGLNDLSDYIKWVSSCQVVITSDSLGLHLASALRKKVVAIVGPTENYEYSYGRISFVKPLPRECMPCNQPECHEDSKCLDEVSVNTVLEKIDRCLSL